MGFFDFLKKQELSEIVQLKAELEKFKPITDVEAECASQRKRLDELVNSKTIELKTLQENFNELNANYQNALLTYAKLRNEVSLSSQKLTLLNMAYISQFMILKNQMITGLPKIKLLKGKNR